MADLADAPPTGDRTQLVEPVSGPPPADTARRGRSIAATVLVLLTAIAVLASTVAVWAKATVLDSDRFTAVVSDVLDDPAVIDPVAAELTDQLLTLLVTTGAVESALGPLAPAAPVLLGAVRGTVEDRVADLLATERAQDLLASAVRGAHAATVSLLRGDGLGFDLQSLEVEGGEVRLDLSGLILAAVQVLLDLFPDDWDLPQATDAAADLRAAVEERFDVSLPEDFGTVVVYDSDSLARAEVAVAEAQRGLAIAERAVTALVLVTLLLGVAAFAVSVRRRRTAIQLAVAVALAGALGVLVIGRLVEALPAVVTDPAAREAALVIMSSFTDGLIGLTRALVVLGALAAAAGWLAGPSASATAVRRRVGELGGPARAAAAHRDAARLAGAVAALLVLWWWGWSWFTLVLAAALAAAGVALPARIAADRPDEAPA